MARTAPTNHDYDTGTAYTDQDGDQHLNGSVVYVDGNAVIDLGDGGLNRKVILADDDVTLDAGDAGCVVISTAVDVVVTLPATIAGFECTVIAGIVSTTTGLSLSPAAADKIIGNGFTAADDKDAVNTAATDAVGNALSVIGDGVDGWYITNVVGTWARET